METPEGKRGVYLFLFHNFQACSCSSFNYPIIYPLLVYKYTTTDDQLNESNLLFILKLNHPDTIVYNDFTLFVSQFSSVQISTASSDLLNYLIKYSISPRTFLPLNKWYTSSAWLIYLNRETWYLWLPNNQTWRKLFGQRPWKKL